MALGRIASLGIVLVSYTNAAWSGVSSNVPLPDKEKFYPELDRAKNMGDVVPGSNGPKYDVEGCREIGEVFENQVSHRKLKDLGWMKDLFHIKDFRQTPVPCDPYECRLRVITIHAGKPLNITDGAAVACETADGSIGSCALRAGGVVDLVQVAGDPDPTAEEMKRALSNVRGNVIIADKIRISGVVKLGVTNTVLIARNEIEFVGGATLESRWRVAGGNGLGALWQASQGAIADRAHKIARDGKTATVSAGNIFLIAPRIVGAGTIDVRGASGGKGGDALCGLAIPPANGGSGGPGGKIYLWSPSVAGTIITLAAGGAGGPAGGYVGARRGDPIGTRRPAPCPAYPLHTNNGALGVNGGVFKTSLAEQGFVAFTLARRLADANLANADYYARKFDPGAGASGPSAAANAAAVVKAATREVLDNFCNNVSPPWRESWRSLFASRPPQEGAALVPVTNVPAIGPLAPAVSSSGAAVASKKPQKGGAAVASKKPQKGGAAVPSKKPKKGGAAVPSKKPSAAGSLASAVSSIVAAVPVTIAPAIGSFASALRSVVPDVDRELELDRGTELARQRACDKAGALLKKVESGVNYFGFPADYYVYQLPDAMKGYRDTLKTIFDERKNSFRDLTREIHKAEITNDSAKAMVNQQKNAANRHIEERRKSEGIAGMRQKQAYDKMVRALLLFQTYQSEIKTLSGTIDPLARAIADAIRARGCSFVCWAGHIVEFAANIESAINAAKDGKWGKWAKDAFTAGMAIYDLYKDTHRDAVNWAKSLFGSGDGIGQALSGSRPTEELLNQQSASGAGIRNSVTKWSNFSNEVRTALNGVYDVRAKAAQHSDDIVDPPTARSKADSLEQVLLRMQVLADDALKQHEELIRAGADLLVTDAEADLAKMQIAHAEEERDQLKCLLGEIRSSDPRCAGVQSIIVPLDKAKKARDAACSAARAMNERVLLLDYLAYRARDYFLLSSDKYDKTKRVNDRVRASYDFSRNLLVTKDNDAFVAKGIETLQKMLESLQDEQLLPVNGTVLPEENPDGGVAIAASSYYKSVMDTLREKGRATFELSVNCGRTFNGRMFSGGCNSAIDADDSLRRRVIDFNVKPIVQGNYSLENWRIGYGHESKAQFAMARKGRMLVFADFVFPKTAAQQICLAVKAVAGTQVGDCAASGFFFFEGVSALGPNDDFPIVNTPREPRDLSRVFGTSLLGAWTVDIRETLNLRNFDDGCYKLEGIVTSDLARAASPGVGALGGRPRLNAGMLNNTANLRIKNACVPPPVLGVPPPNAALAATCRQYFVKNERNDTWTMPPNPHNECCTNDGLPIVGADARECAGYLTPKACSIPDVCWKICGPKCKEFKQALKGFRYRAYTRIHN